MLAQREAGVARGIAARHGCAAVEAAGERGARVARGEAHRDRVPADQLHVGGRVVDGDRRRGEIDDEGVALHGPGAMPQRTVGADVPVTVVDDRRVYVVNGDKVNEFSGPGESPKLQPCVSWTGRLYCADDASGTVYELDANGALANTITVPNAGRTLELEVREDHLFINAPDGRTARVVDNHHRVKVVDKYANNILGGDPPPPVPPPPPQQPPVGPPGAPVNVRAAAGNAQARVSWNPAPANGAPIIKYVVEGDGKPHEVGAGIGASVRRV